MDIEKAKRLVKEIGLDFSGKNNVVRGLQILAKYEDDVCIRFDHDMIWASDFKKTVSKMPEDDVIQMAKLGWFYDEKWEDWAHF